MWRLAPVERKVLERLQDGFKPARVLGVTGRRLVQEHGGVGK
jgi:hypothetical protein